MKVAALQARNVSAHGSVSSGRKGFQMWKWKTREMKQPEAVELKPGTGAGHPLLARGLRGSIGMGARMLAGVCLGALLAAPLSGCRSAVALGEADPVVPTASPAPGGEKGPGDSATRTSGDVDRYDAPRLYQVLYDTPVGASPLGQNVRIRLWAQYMGLSRAQLELLKGIGKRFQERKQGLEAEQREAQERYARELEPLFLRVQALLAQPSPNPQEMDRLAEEIAGIQVAQRKEDALQVARIRTVRSVLGDAREFLNTLDPVQEEKLVTALFFLRQEVDPFANPGTYREIVGPTWNAGDFSSLLRQKDRRDQHLNIGGLWGIDTDTAERFNYVNIQRPMLMFFILKEPTLVAAIDDQLLATAEGVRP